MSGPDSVTFCVNCSKPVHEQKFTKTIITTPPSPQPPLEQPVVFSDHKLDGELNFPIDKVDPQFGIEIGETAVEHNVDSIREDDQLEEQNSERVCKFSPEEIASSLQALYKLNYLNYFDDDPIFESAPTLCIQCEDVLSNLHRYYEEFNHLRQLESHLAKIISRLDKIIESQRQSVVKCEVLTEEDEHGEVDLPDVFPYDADDDFVPEREEFEESEPRVARNVRGPGPWVVLNKVKLPEGKRSIRASDITGEEDVVDVDEDDLEHDVVTLSDGSEFALSDDGGDSDFNEPRRRKRKSKIDARASLRLLHSKNLPATPKKPGPKSKSKSSKLQKTKTTKSVKVKSNSKKKHIVISKQKQNVTLKKAQKGASKKNKKETEVNDFNQVEGPVKKQRGRKRKSEAQPKLVVRRRQPLRVDKHYRKRKCNWAHPCWHCKMNFDNNEDCRKHAEEEHMMKSYHMCEDCSRVCKTKQGLEYHKSMCASWMPGQKMPDFECPVCHKHFTWKTYYKVHVKLHGDERPFSCSKCKYRAKSRMLIRMHEKRMHDESAQQDQRLQCGQCESFFKNEQGLRIHIYYHHTEEGNKKYRESQRANYQKKKEQRMQMTKNRTFICQECNVDFFSNLRLLCHRKMYHQTEKNYVCDQCGKDFTKNRSLQHHIAHVHSDARPFICEHCGKSFKTNYNLKDHVEHTHSEEGRRKYNEKMRIHHQRRRLVAEALARKREAERLGLPPPDPVPSTSNVTTDKHALQAPPLSAQLPAPTALPPGPPPPPVPLEPSAWQVAAATAGLCFQLPLNSPPPDGLLNLSTLPQFPVLPQMEFDGSSSQSGVSE